MIGCRWSQRSPRLPDRSSKLVNTSVIIRRLRSWCWRWHQRLMSILSFNDKMIVIHSPGADVNKCEHTDRLNHQKNDMSQNWFSCLGLIASLINISSIKIVAWMCELESPKCCKLEKKCRYGSSNVERGEWVCRPKDRYWCSSLDERLIQ